MNITTIPSKYEVLRGRIDRVLMQWDPIGVKNEPAAQDEYRTYTEAVYALIKHGKKSSFEATARGIADYLFEVEVDLMSLKGSWPRAHIAADLITMLDLPKSPSNRVELKWTEKDEKLACALHKLRIQPTESGLFALEQFPSLGTTLFLGGWYRTIEEAQEAACLKESWK